MRVSVGTRRFLGGLLILGLAGYFASTIQSPLRGPALVGGFAFGWLLMKLLIATGHAEPPHGGRSTLPASTAIGLGIAFFASSALSAIDPSGPLLLAVASLAFVAGLVLSLRFSRLGLRNI